jgi:hypothetical protein
MGVKVAALAHAGAGGRHEPNSGTIRTEVQRRSQYAAPLSAAGLLGGALLLYGCETAGIEALPYTAPPATAAVGGSVSSRDSDSDAGTPENRKDGGSISDSQARCAQIAAQNPVHAPLRRLTRFEYNNSVRDLLGDTTSPAKALPSEEIGNGFGNDADSQSVSGLLAEQLSAVAAAVAQRATAADAIGKLHRCIQNVKAENETACARNVLEQLATRAYRHALAVEDLDELMALYTSSRAEATFATALATAIEAVLQTPDFMYRIEFGELDPAQPERRRPSGAEMATRLSYLFWGSVPDAALTAAAESGELSTAAGVRTQASRLLADKKARPILRFFFDNLLPIATLAQLPRDAAVYPNFNANIGGLMREETQRVLEYEIFEGTGTWSGALTAPYTFVDETLAKFYDIPNVSGNDFRKVALDTNRRLGVLTLGGVMAGSTPSNHTNPVLRGSFVAQKLLCMPLALPTDPSILAKVKPPDPYSGKTARDRFGAHSKDPVCAGCHQFMDPIGLTFENFDAVGLYRTQENGVTIDASGHLPGSNQRVTGAVGLVRGLASSDTTQNCFVAHWLDFAYGRTLSAADPVDACTQEQVQQAFLASGGDVQKLLVDLTQTDAFLFLPPALSTDEKAKP